MDTSFIIPAFIAGLLTFFAPCTLPLVPGFLGFISGASADDLKDEAKSGMVRKKVFKNALLYVIGFSAVFVLMGTVLGAAGLGLTKYKAILSRVGGVMVIIFGLYMMHILKIRALNFLNSEHKLNIISKLHPGKPSSSFLLGATFAFGWTPCVGPILGTILTLALTTQAISKAIFLLSIFSLGLAVPFLLLALVFGSAAQYIKKFSKYVGVISFIGGLFLVIIGFLLVTDNLILWNARVYELFDFVNYDRILDYL